MYTSVALKREMSDILEQFYEEMGIASKQG